MLSCCLYDLLQAVSVNKTRRHLMQKSLVTYQELVILSQERREVINEMINVTSKIAGAKVGEKRVPVRDESHCSLHT